MMQTYAIYADGRIVVRDGDTIHTKADSLVYHFFYGYSAIQKTEFGMNMEVDKG